MPITGVLTSDTRKFLDEAARRVTGDDAVFDIVAGGQINSVRIFDLHRYSSAV